MSLLRSQKLHPLVVTFLVVVASLLTPSAPVGAAPTSPVASTILPLSGCFTPVCAPIDTRVSFGGGPVLNHPYVYLVRFISHSGLVSAKGYVPGTFKATAPNAASLAMATLRGPGSAVLKEYHLTVPYKSARFGGYMNVVSPLASAKTISDPEIATALGQPMNKAFVPKGYQPIFILFTPSGQTVIDGNSTSQAGFCAYHSFDASPTMRVLPYVVVPNEGLASTCDDVPGGATSSFEQMGPQLSHELFETVTDPTIVPGFTDVSTGNEIADICQGSIAFAGRVNYRSHAYYLAPVYSKTAHACITGQVPVAITATISTTSLSVTVLSTVGPVANQIISLTSTGSVSRKLTSQTGSVIFPLPTHSAVLSFSSTGPYDSASLAVPSFSTSHNSPSLIVSQTAPTLSGNEISSPGSITVTLTDPSPVPNASLLLVADGTTVIDHAVTSNLGVATFTPSADVPLNIPLQIVFSGSTSLYGATTVVSPVDLLPVTVTAPPSWSTAGIFPISVSLGPVFAGDPIYINNQLTSLTSGSLDSSGSFSSQVAITTPGDNLYTIVIVVGPWRVVSLLAVTLTS